MLEPQIVFTAIPKLISTIARLDTRTCLLELFILDIGIFWRLPLSATIGCKRDPVALMSYPRSFCHTCDLLVTPAQAGMTCLRYPSSKSISKILQRTWIPAPRPRGSRHCAPMKVRVWH